MFLGFITKIILENHLQQVNFIFFNREKPKSIKEKLCYINFIEYIDIQYSISMHNPELEENLYSKIYSSI